MIKRLFYSGAAAIVVLAGMPAEAKPANCVMIVEDVSYIDGLCDFDLLSDGKGSFRITGADGRHFAYVYLESQDRATAHWNGELGENRAHDPLGTLTREGECWINDTARICVASKAASAVTNGTPYGKWDCGNVMEFSLDASTYTVNGKKVSVANVEQPAEDAYGVTLVDSYRFALFDVGPTSLTWHSPESGDTFDCKRE